MILPLGAGGAMDILARGQFAPQLSERLGKPVVIENRTGGGTVIAANAVAKSPPDGYTLLVVSTGFVVNPSLYAKVPYDPIKEFAPITLIAASPNVMVVNPEVPARSVKELIELIKANPGKYYFSSSGNGSAPQLFGEAFTANRHIDERQ